MARGGGGSDLPAEAAGLDPRAFLDANDSYAYFARLGCGHLRTGPARTSILNLAVALAD